MGFTNGLIVSFIDLIFKILKYKKKIAFENIWNVQYVK